MASDRSASAPLRYRREDVGQANLYERRPVAEYAQRCDITVPRVAAMPGVCHVVAVGDNAVAVVAQTWWQAKRALEALPITWDESPGALLTTELLLQHFREGLEHRTCNWPLRR
jgi:hypothetical protein